MRRIYLSLLYLFSISLLACINSKEYKTYVFPLEAQNIAKVKVAPDIQDKIIVKDLKVYSKKNFTIVTLILKNITSESLTTLRKVVIFTKDENTLNLPNFEDTYFYLDPYEEKHIKVAIPQNLDRLSRVIIYIKSFVKK